MFTLWIYGWLEKINETSLPEKEDFYSNLTDEDYTHGKRVCKGFKRKNLGEYHDLHVQSNTWLLPDIFENLKYMNLTPLAFLLYQV